MVRELDGRQQILYFGSRQLDLWNVTNRRRRKTGLLGFGLNFREMATGSNRMNISSPKACIMHSYGKGLA